MANPSKINSEEYIIPTKKSPIFKAECTAFGSIEGPFKPFAVEEKTGICTGDTFETDFARAVNDLHEWIKNWDALEETKSGFFRLQMIDGSLDKHGAWKEKKVYQISVSKAKQLLK